MNEEPNNPDGGWPHKKLNMSRLLFLIAIGLVVSNVATLFLAVTLGNALSINIEKEVRLSALKATAEITTFDLEGIQEASCEEDSYDYIECLSKAYAELIALPGASNPDGEVGGGSNDICQSEWESCVSACNALYLGPGDSTGEWQQCNEDCDYEYRLCRDVTGGDTGGDDPIAP